MSANMDLDQSLGDLPTRPMRVKVLYTFDADSKTNCLARLPDVLSVPAISVDEQSYQIGLIELQKCVHAITLASPELLSRLEEGDFTMYAFDYSEPDVPLVGHGRLSSLVGDAPTEQKFITGRVRENALMAFSQGVKEILEVKLRMVPVPKQVQSRLTSGSFALTSAVTTAGFDPNVWQQSQQHSQDYFTSFHPEQLHQDPQSQSLIEEIFNFGGGDTIQQSGGSGQSPGGAGHGGIANTLTDSAFSTNPAFSTGHSHSAPGSRAGSPMTAPEARLRNSQLRHQSFSANSAPFETEQRRPGSSASLRSEYNSSNQCERYPSQPTHQTNQQAETFFDDDGQPRKRAKVMQTNWRGRSTFGKGSSDLRVTAATAASVHMHRPIAQRPNAAPGSNLEPPPRVPTPVPHLNRSLPQQQLGRARSMLRQDSTISAIASDYLSDIDSDALMSSPEEELSPLDAGQGTPPEDIPSSPPVFFGVNAPQPSSPGLPTLPLPRIADSGYLSEAGKLFDNSGMAFGDNKNGNRSPSAEDFGDVAHYGAHEKEGRSIKMESVTPSERTVKHPRLPAHMASGKLFDSEKPSLDKIQGRGYVVGTREQALRRETLQRLSVDNESTKADESCFRLPDYSRKHSSDSTRGAEQGDDPMLSVETPTAALEPSQSRRNSLALPGTGLPKQTGAKYTKTSMSRSHSTFESEIGSPAPSDSESSRRPSGLDRSGSGAQRRRLIEQRLQDSLANGEIPPHCCHCGAIETPTWRRMYFKLCDGKPSPLDAVEGEGETIGIDEIEWDEHTGICSKFVIRKSLRKVGKGEGGPQVGKGFRDVQVCNPCGLWFNKFKTMRPPEKWNRKTTTRRTRNRGSKKADGDLAMSTDGLEPRSELLQSDAIFTDLPQYEDDGNGGTANMAHRDLHPRPGIHFADHTMASQNDGAATETTRSNSVRSRPKATAALGRDVQSSPPRLQGSKASPIELEDLTPQPTRRQLFPSPRNEGEFKTLDAGDVTSELQRSKEFSGKFWSANKGETVAPKDLGGPTDVWTARTEKENMPPPALLEEQDELSRLLEGSPSGFFRTPTKLTTPRKTGSGRSISARELELLKTPTPASRKRKPLTPDANAANNASLNAISTGMGASDWLTSPSSGRYFLRSTPTRLAQTPNRYNSASQPSSHHGATNNDGQGMTPFSKHVAQILAQEHQGVLFTSPSRAGAPFDEHFDFSDLPTFMTPGLTPGKRIDVDWEAVDGILSSDFCSSDNAKGAAEDGRDGKAEEDN